MFIFLYANLANQPVSQHFDTLERGEVSNDESRIPNTKLLIPIFEKCSSRIRR